MIRRRDLLRILRLIQHGVDVGVDDVGQSGENAHIRTFRLNFSGMVFLEGVVLCADEVEGGRGDPRDQEAGDEEAQLSIDLRDSQAAETVPVG